MRKNKEVFKLRAYRYRPIRQGSWANINVNVRKKWNPYAIIPSHSIKVHGSMISNKQKLAKVIRDHFGFGKFSIMFFNRWCKSKRYNPNFKCMYQRGKKCNYKSKCRIYSRHKKGWSCKANRKFQPNWSIRARVEIFPYLDFNSNVDFKFKFDKKDMKMYFFRNSFWNDK